MKKRKGFRPISIGQLNFLYRVSLSTNQIIIYDSLDNRHILQMIELPIFKNMSQNNSWRGKHKDAGWNKKAIGALIRYYL